jgi:glycerate kinase
MTDQPSPVVAVAQAFKETLGASDVAEAYRAAAREEGIEAVVLVGSDGGDDLLESLRPQVIRETSFPATGPLGNPVRAPVCWLDHESAVIESRLVCGLALVPQEHRDPSRTTTRGLGELILGAADAGARRLYVGLGGSATMDGGMGMARAWGWTPRDGAGDPLGDGGGELVRLAAVDVGRCPPVEVVGLADVRSPLCGDDGAWVFAGQKGASVEEAAALDRGLRRLAAVLGEAGAAWAEEPGAGAAGGLGFGILAFAGGRVTPGASWVLSRLGFEAALENASAVIVGEGGFDATSTRGKLTGEVIRAAARAGIPTGLLAPTAADVPPGVLVESGRGRWDAAELERRARTLMRRMLRLPPA